MILPPIVMLKLKQKAEMDFNAPSERDFHILSKKIEDVTKCHLGINSLKRLVGHINYENHSFRPGTLNIIAQYLGYPSWTNMMFDLEEGSSGFHNIEEELKITDLNEGQVVEVSYLPNRRLQFVYIGNSNMEVLESENSHLQEGDLCQINSLLPEYPLIISKVVRDGQDMGSYTAARIGGLQKIKILK